jgi:hypothetical protein
VSTEYAGVLREQMIGLIERQMRYDNVTQTQLAALAGTTIGKVNGVLRGRRTRVDINDLDYWLYLLGCHFELKVVRNK